MSGGLAVLRRIA